MLNTGFETCAFSKSLSKHQLKKKQMIKIRYFIEENIINKGKQFSNEKVTFPTSSVIKKTK